MHHILKIIVKAKSKEEALKAAKRDFVEIKEGGNGIDYGTFFDDDESTISGPARWGRMPSAIRLDSKQGAQMLICTLEGIYEEFIDRLNKVREKIDKSSEDLFLDGMWKYYCHALYQNDWLFVESTPADLERLNSYLEDPAEGTYVWIIPVDVHT